MTPAQIALFVAASLAVPAAVLVIFLYLRSSFQLLEALRAKHPEVWRSLGAPERIYVRGTEGPGIHTIQPIGPWLAWLCSGRQRALSSDVAAQFHKTRFLLITAALALGCALLAFVGLIAAGPESIQP